MIRFRFVDEHRNAHGVKRMCDVLGWDRSGYYTWHKNKETRQQRVDEEEELARQIREIHTDSRGAYGALRITRALRVQGHVVNRKRVARVMRERQIAGITRRKSRSLTKPDRTAPPAPDLIQRDFTAPMPGLKLVGDITCLSTAEGWLYLATVIDLCSREVVGWSMTPFAWLTSAVIRPVTRFSAPIAGRNRRQSNSRKHWRSWTSGRVQAEPARASIMRPRRASSPYSSPRSAPLLGRPGGRPGRTYSDGSRSITTESGSTRPSATSPRIRHGPAISNASTSRHKPEVSDLRGSLQGTAAPIAASLRLLRHSFLPRPSACGSRPFRKRNHLSDITLGMCVILFR